MKNILLELLVISYVFLSCNNQQATLNIKEEYRINQESQEEKESQKIQENQKNEQQQSGVNAAGTPLSIFEVQQEDIKAGLSPKESPSSLDYIKTYMESIKENPNFDMDAVMYNMDNVNGPYMDVKRGLRWAIKMPYEEYQKLYPELTEDIFNALKDRYNIWETVYNNGTIGDYAKANASQVDPVTWYLNENNPFRRQTFTIKPAAGHVDSH